MDEQAASAPAGEPSLPPETLVEPTPRPAGPPPLPPGGRRPRRQAPVRLREFAAIILMVALADLTIYRARGLAGFAGLLVAGAILLVWGSPRPRFGAGSWLVGTMLLALAARLLWQGSGPVVLLGFGLLVALAMALSGRRPYLGDVVAYAAHTPLAGLFGLAHYRRTANRLGLRIPGAFWLNVGLPLAVLALFAGLFVLANPDVVNWVTHTAIGVWSFLSDWVRRLSLTAREVIFWLVVALVTIGLLRPVLRRSGIRLLLRPRLWPHVPQPPVETRLYAGLRNTLMAVIGLFAVYLVFEYQTLWHRTFPPGFYYGGYAHQGAAWLTAALALATVLLSLVFRGRVLRDPRLPVLRRLARVWSLENLLLAVAVYHRLAIYIDFNGMTRMRTVGLFGTSAVLAGFMLVVWKLATGRNFAWLVQRQLWALAIAVYLLAITPVDAIVHGYNVRQVLSGRLAPSVQLSVQPISAEGVLVLRPLVRCENEIIREGVQALLAERSAEAEKGAIERAKQGWIAFQLADQTLLDHLRAIQSDWAPFARPAKRAAALKRFRDYVYQWY